MVTHHVKSKYGYNAIGICSCFLKTGLDKGPIFGMVAWEDIEERVKIGKSILGNSVLGNEKITGGLLCPQFSQAQSIEDVGPTKQELTGQLLSLP